MLHPYVSREDWYSPSTEKLRCELFYIRRCIVSREPGQDATRRRALGDMRGCHYFKHTETSVPKPLQERLLTLQERLEGASRDQED